MPLAAGAGAAVPYAARAFSRHGTGRERRQWDRIERDDLSREGDVALSVTISSVSTLVGVVATPLLTRLYVDAHIQVDVMGMLLSILQIVVIPIALGLVIHHTLPKVVKAVEPFLPAFSMICIPAIISAVVAGSASHIASVGLVVIVAVILHNAIGLLGGYWGGRLFGFDESTCRTLAIEVGCKTLVWLPRWGKSTSARSPRCPVRCFQSGTTCPVRCWRVTGPGNRPPKREQTLIFSPGPTARYFPVCALLNGTNPLSVGPRLPYTGLSGRLRAPRWHFPHYAKR